VLSHDASSYYDFDEKFEKYFSKNDCIATDGIFGFYYADFCYSDFNFIFGNSKDRSLELVKKKGFTKLLTKNETAVQFAKRKLKDCDNQNLKLISSYIGTNSYYLYKIEYMPSNYHMALLM